jgi:hypothetical protein
MGVIEHHWSTSGFDVAQERHRARKNRTVNIATVPAHRSRREVIQERQADLFAANRAEARGRCDPRCEIGRLHPARQGCVTGCDQKRTGYSRTAAAGRIKAAVFCRKTCRASRGNSSCVSMKRSSAPEMSADAVLWRKRHKPTEPGILT